MSVVESRERLITQMEKVKYENQTSVFVNTQQQYVSYMNYFTPIYQTLTFLETFYFSNTTCPKKQHSSYIALYYMFSEYVHTLHMIINTISYNNNNINICKAYNIKFNSII